MKQVYLVFEDVQYEHTKTHSVHEVETDAKEKARELANSHRYGGEWSEWESDDPHILSIQNRDVTFMVKVYEVE